MPSSLDQDAFKAGQRQNPRIDFPATVIINNKEFDVIEWSLGGFSLPTECVLATELISEINEANLRFELPQKKVEVDVKISVVRCDDQGFAVGFQFIELPDHIQSTLQSIVGGYLSGEKISLDQALENGVKGKLFEFEQARLMASWGKFASITFVIAALLFFALYLVYQKLYVIKSEHAAIAQRVVRIQAPSTGVLDDISVQLGDSIKAKQSLFSIASDTNQERLRQKKSEAAATSLEVEHLKNRYRDAKSLLTSFSSRLDANIQGLEKRIRAIKAEIKVQKEQYQLFERNHAIGVVDEITKNDALLQLFEKKRALMLLEQELSNTKNQKHMTREGLLARDDVSSLPTVNELEDLLNYKTNYVTLLETEIASIFDSMNTHSPCDCDIVEVNATNGPVTSGQTIMHLSPRSENPKWILALVDLESDKKLYKGAPAKFKLASESNSRSGTVDEISYYSASQPIVYSRNGETYSGLPDSLPRMQQYTLVKIIPDEPIENVSYKEPVLVSISLGLFSRLTRNLM
ncbi:PilZ domain-containing protein [Vibrio intestinalis]|uniref:PilZ domain-containing protein n=1 Tax=Vibrio intestinalis TaxID=2933291 RepID=UPI0021A4F153|nr:PilZ domain-containing protein [Vibrio intestinalis]